MLTAPQPKPFRQGEALGGDFAPFSPGGGEKANMANTLSHWLEGWTPPLASRVHGVCGEKTF